MDNPVTSEHERARLALPGQRTDNGAFATFVITADQHGGWSFQPHGASALGVRVEDAHAVAPLSLRCGRADTPVMHLTELAETLRQRGRPGGRDPIVTLCCDLNGLDTGADDDYDGPELSEAGCPGCVDCLRYCPECLREAARFAGGVVRLAATARGHIEALCGVRLPPGVVTDDHPAGPACLRCVADGGRSLLDSGGGFGWFTE